MSWFKWQLYLFYDMAKLVKSQISNFFTSKLFLMEAARLLLGKMGNPSTKQQLCEIYFFLDSTTVIFYMGFEGSNI